MRASLPLARVDRATAVADTEPTLPVQRAAAAPMASRWFRFNLWVHRWTGLIATLPFLVLCLTGTVLIFHDEIDAALGVVPVSESRSGTAPARPLADSVRTALAAFPAERVASVALDPKEYPGVALLFTVPSAATSFDDGRLRYTDLSTGRLLGGAAQADKTLTGVLLELHSQWFLGPIGELIGALVGLFVLLALLSGLVVYAPYVKRTAFGILRRDRGPRLLQLDLHNFIGALVLGWAFAVTVTGFLLGFGTVAVGVWQNTELRALRAQQAGAAVDARHPPVDVDRALAAATAAAEPGWRVISIIFPRTDFSTDRHYTVLMGGATGLDQRLFRVTLVDAASGKVVATKGLPWYLKAMFLAQPLHFGDYGGLPLKLLWTACTWLTLFITANGAWLWWDRRRRRAPLTEARA